MAIKIQFRSQKLNSCSKLVGQSEEEDWFRLKERRRTVSDVFAFLSIFPWPFSLCFYRRASWITCMSFRFKCLQEKTLLLFVWFVWLLSRESVLLTSWIILALRCEIDLCLNIFSLLLFSSSLLLDRLAQPRPLVLEWFELRSSDDLEWETTAENAKKGKSFWKGFKTTELKFWKSNPKRKQICAVGKTNIKEAISRIALRIQKTHH